MIDLTNGYALLTQFSWSFGIALIFLTYWLSTKLHQALGSPMILHPLLIAVAIVAVSLHLLPIPYELFFDSVEPLHLLLGPVVVLLAVPLWRQLAAIHTIGFRLLPVLLIGSLTGIATAAGVAFLLGAPEELIATLSIKSVTTPVAMELSESLGGVPAITSMTVILSSLVGASIGWPLLVAFGLTDPRAMGFAIGVGANVLGTARAFQINQVAGAFSGLGMILNAVMTTGLIALYRLFSDN